MMKRFGIVLCLVLVGLLSNVRAEEDSNRTVTMDTIVVTAGRVQEKKADVSANITVISELQIEESSAQDLGELLAYQGIMIREYPNSLSSVEVRGFRTETHGNDLSSYVLILVNGRRAGTGNIGKISMENVERVEIIRGPASVQYGASAMGGIINVITKKGKDEFSASATETLGSYNYRKTGVSLTAGKSGVDLTFSGSKESQGDYTTADEVTYYNTGYDTKDRISVNTGWTFLPENRVGILYTGYWGEGIGSPNYLSDNTLNEYGEASKTSMDLTYDGQIKSGTLSWNLRYFKGKDEYETYDRTAAPELTYFRDTDQQGAQAQLNTDFKMVQITTGFDWTNYEVTNSYTEAGSENSYDNPAGFLMAKIKLLDETLILSAGTRYDNYNVESDDGQSKKENNVSSNAGLVYKFSPTLSVRMNYAEAFKMPTADQLYMFNDYGSMGVWSGNPGLKPETSTTYDIGVDMHITSFYGSLTYYTTDFEDKIGYRYNASEGYTQYENMNGAGIDGIEGEFGFHMGDFFGWAYDVKPYVSFSCLTKRDDEQDNTTLLYTPKWTGASGIRIARPETGFTSVLNVTYTDDQDINDYEGTGETVLPSKTVTDLTMSKRLIHHPSWGALHLKTSIRNLFNEDYALIQGYPSPGRSFFIGLKYDY